MSKPQPAPLSQRTIERLRAEARREDAAAAEAFKDAVLRDANNKPTGIRDSALEHVTILARRGKHPEFIASRLGLSTKQLKNLCGTGDAPSGLGRPAFQFQ